MPRVAAARSCGPAAAAPRPRAAAPRGVDTTPRRVRCDDAVLPPPRRRPTASWARRRPAFTDTRAFTDPRGPARERRRRGLVSTTRRLSMFQEKVVRSLIDHVAQPPLPGLEGMLVQRIRVNRTVVGGADVQATVVHDLQEEADGYLDLHDTVFVFGLVEVPVHARIRRRRHVDGHGVPDRREPDGEKRVVVAGVQAVRPFHFVHARGERDGHRHDLRSTRRFADARLHAVNTKDQLHLVLLGVHVDEDVPAPTRRRVRLGRGVREGRRLDGWRRRRPRAADAVARGDARTRTTAPNVRTRRELGETRTVSADFCSVGTRAPSSRRTAPMRFPPGRDNK